MPLKYGIGIVRAILSRLNRKYECNVLETNTIYILVHLKVFLLHSLVEIYLKYLLQVACHLNLPTPQALQRSRNSGKIKKTTFFTYNEMVKFVQRPVHNGPSRLTASNRHSVRGQWRKKRTIFCIKCIVANHLADVPFDTTVH